MPMKDGLDPVHPLPQFLTEKAELDTGNPLNGDVPASRVFKASVLIIAAAATGIAVLAVGNPMALFAEGSASLVDSSPPQSTPTIQSATDAPALAPSTADAQVLSPTRTDEPSRNEIAASEPAGKDQAENSVPASATLFEQFQTWAAEQEAQARGGPVQPVQDAPPQVVQAPARVKQNAPAPAAENVRAPHRLVQKRRHVRPVRNARAEMRTQDVQTQVRRAQSERAERPPVQDARAQEQSGQNAQPSWLPGFGLRN